MHNIRTATEDDIEAILDLYADTGLDDGQRLDDDKARELLACISSYPNYRLFVLEGAEESVLATYALLIMDNIAHIGRTLAIVEQVAVGKAHQRKGLAAEMMKHAIDEARRFGCYKLALSSNVRFEAAHSFYEKIGFVRHGYSFHVNLEPNLKPEVFDV